MITDIISLTLVLSCSVSGVSGDVRVMCDASNPLQPRQFCFLDTLDISLPFDCKSFALCSLAILIVEILPTLEIFFLISSSLFNLLLNDIIGNATSIVLSVEDYSPGDYNLSIVATDVFGQSVTTVIEVFLSGEIFYIVVCVASG